MKAAVTETGASVSARAAAARTMRPHSATARQGATLHRVCIALLLHAPTNRSVSVKLTAAPNLVGLDQSITFPSHRSVDQSTQSPHAASAASAPAGSSLTHAHPPRR